MAEANWDTAVSNTLPAGAASRAREAGRDDERGRDGRDVSERDDE
jgi:hypothetical protein